MEMAVGGDRGIARCFDYCDCATNTCVFELIERRVKVSADPLFPKSASHLRLKAQTE